MAASIPCLVADDGTWASVAGERLGPAEVEDLIWRLAACRQAMTPRRRPVMFDGSRVVLGDGWTRTPDGVVAVHHPALGWVGAMVRPAAAPSGKPAAEPSGHDGRPAPPG